MPKISSPLTELAIKNLKPQDKPYRKSDGSNLLLKVSPVGTKTFELEYRIPNSTKRRKIALGNYPILSLKEAREKAFELKRQIAQGVDPQEDTKNSKDWTFEAVARRFMDIKDNPRRNLRRLEMYVFPKIGGKNIGKITTDDIVFLLKPLEQAGKLETAHIIFQLISQIYKSVGGYCPNITTQISYRHTFKMPNVKNYATLTDYNDIRILLRLINEYKGEASTIVAVKLSILTAMRPFNVRAAQWNELDLDSGVWRVEASKMKMKQDFVLPLNTQAVALLKKSRLFLYDDYLFGKFKPMSENTVNGALRRLGYTGEQIVAHGFRAMFSSICHEFGLDSRIIEKCLAHADKNSVRAVSNRDSELEAMRLVMQFWGDFLDKLLAGETPKPKIILNPMFYEQ